MQPFVLVPRVKSPTKIYAFIFFGIMYLIFMILNSGMTKLYIHRWSTIEGGEWQKKKNFLHQRSSQSMDFILLGDSTVACGVRPRVMTGDGFNLARSGMDPSELPMVLDYMAKNGVHAKNALISFFPGFMSQNDWKNGFSVPYRVAFLDALTQFYEDSNSMKPLLLFGNGTLTRYFERSLDQNRIRGRGANEKRHIDSDGAHLIDEAITKPYGTKDMPLLRTRRANYTMLRRLKQQMESQGMRVIWVLLPYRSDYQRALETDPIASRFYAGYLSEVKQMFGADILDMRGVLKDDDFKDWAHLKADGATRLSRALDMEMQRHNNMDSSKHEAPKAKVVQCVE